MVSSALSFAPKEKQSIAINSPWQVQNFDTSFVSQSLIFWLMQGKNGHFGSFHYYVNLGLARQNLSPPKLFIRSTLNFHRIPSTLLSTTALRMLMGLSYIVFKWFTFKLKKVSQNWPLLAIWKNNILISHCEQAIGDIAKSDTRGS